MNSLSSDQHWFRAGYSTGSYMLELISVIENNVKSHTFTPGIFVDLQKAFDSNWLGSLGIYLDEKLSFDKQLARCQNTIQQKWNLLKRFIFNGLSVETSKCILPQVIMPKRII